MQLELELAQGHSHDFDAIAVDAFSSGAIPVHLLTAECGDIYRRRLAPGGILLLHISNRTLNLEPVARGLARSLGWKTIVFASGQDEQTGESSARWAVLTSTADFRKRSGVAQEVAPWGGRDAPPITWTDDFASLWQVVEF